MGTFVQIRPNNNILKSLEGKKSTLIVACAGCANNSVAYDKIKPVYKVETDEKGNKMLIPYAIHDEAERVKTMLGENGIKADIELNDSWCFYTESKELSKMLGSPGWTDQGLKDRCVNYGSILFLGCPDGVNGVKVRVGDKARVIPGMSNIGTYQCFWRFDEVNGVVLIDREKSAFIGARS